MSEVEQTTIGEEQEVTQIIEASFEESVDSIIPESSENEDDVINNATVPVAEQEEVETSIIIKEIEPPVVFEESNIIEESNIDGVVDNDINNTEQIDDENVIVNSNNAVNEENTEIINEELTTNNDNDEELNTSTITSESQEETTPVISRELKSILELSKEAKLDTNLTPRRKTIDNITKQNRECTTMSPKKSLKPSNFPVTAECELENFENADDEQQQQQQQQQNEKLQRKISKKRKSSACEAGVEGAADGQMSMLRKSTQGPLPTNNLIELKPDKDKFCWRCHRDGVEIACETCPRTYHQKCLKQIVTDSLRWPCAECVAILKAENTQTRSKAMKGMTLEHLCTLLKFAVKRMIQCDGSEPFIHPVDEKQFPEYKSYIIQPMNLTMLEKNIKNNVYGSTQAFEADAKWILHNSIIFNSWEDKIKAKTEGVQGKKENQSRNSLDHSKLTSVAKTILKICKQEMAEIENCPSCYLNANTKKHTWFVEVCPKPHLLVWAKLKGFPYWPAKVMSFSSTGMVDVRFFGAHDKAWVNSKDCYLYSIKDPNSGKQKRNDIMECVRELEIYVENLKKIYGKVVHAPFKTLLEPGNEDKYLKSFLPSFDLKQKDTTNTSSKNINDNDNKNIKSAVVNDSNKESCDVDDKVEEKDQNQRQAIPKTRIEFRHSTGSKPRWVVKPLKNVVVKKRHSTDMVVETSKKQRRDSSKSDTEKLENSKKNDTTEKKVGKIKISDQLIQKLNEDVIETTEEISSDRNEEVMEESIKPEEEITADNEDITDKEENLEEPNKENENIINEIEKEQKSQQINLMNGDDEEQKCEQTEEIEMDATKIRNIIHSSLTIVPKSRKKSSEKEQEMIEIKSSDEEKKSKKRKRSNDDNEKNSNDNNIPPTKIVKLVPIENILQKSLDNNESSDKVEPEINTTRKQTVVVKDINSLKNSVESQSVEKDPITESPVTIKNEIESDEDNQYMEAKRQYMSALNISEKQKVPTKPKQHEIRTRSKTEERRSKSVDTAPKTNETPRLTTENNNTNEVESNKTTTTTNDNKLKEIYIKPLSKMQAPKHKARKSFPTPNYAKKGMAKILPKPWDFNMKSQPTSSPSLIVLPKLHYTKTTANTGGNNSSSSTSDVADSVITVVPRLNTNQITLACPPLRSSTGITAPFKNNDDIQKDTNSNNNSNLLVNPLHQDTSNNTTQIDPELDVLREILPENLSKNVNEILCQPPPKLKPKPFAVLNTTNDSSGTALPSTAGPVSARMNLISNKLGDYFRGLVMEVIQELGKSSNPESTISSLKLEIEELNHRHAIELAEIRRNVSIVLKDIQKSIVEERERIINETKANCEIEMIKRVEEAKSKQWCANCMKEAQFYCCWNTSYCDYPCQQKHWLKHMSKCTQTAGQNQGATSTRISGAQQQNQQQQQTHQQQLVLTPTTAPRFRTLIAKPQKVYLKRANSSSFKGQSPGNHITLVESTPGNFELVGGSGSLTVNGKILASSSVMEKIQSGNIVTVTAASNTDTTSAPSSKVSVSSSSSPVTITKNNIASSSDSEH